MAELRKILESCNGRPFVLLETGLRNKENNVSYLFKDFRVIMDLREKDDPDKFFSIIDRAAARGYWSAGYFAYELGYSLEPSLKSFNKKTDYPLAWMGLCEKPLLIKTPISSRPEGIESGSEGNYYFHNIQPNVTYEKYADDISKIKKYLTEGLTYQVNYTFKLKFEFLGDVIDFYSSLRKAQPTSYQALVYTGDAYFLSLSPELFFRYNGRNIISKPMKGTVRRGSAGKEDRSFREWLGSNEKNQAENVMIVDLIRNDLGRISDKVRVPKLFTVEKYPTLYQMTSTITAKLKQGFSSVELFRAMFPCGSVTGAPKIKTMELISGLEKEPRGIYTGAIGYIGPKRACFNVAIRTAVITVKGGEIGIGGGIVADSKPKSEFQEALLKARFLTDSQPDFSIFESLCWDGHKYLLINEHLKRLMRTANCFSFKVGNIKSKLMQYSRKLGKGRYKVRLELNKQGKISLSKEKLAEIKGLVRVKISKQKTDPIWPWLYFKTTRREMYDRELKLARKQGFFEVIFFNKNDEITEGAITNVFIEKNGKLYTPAGMCGLLPGTLREYLILTGKVKEKVISRREFYSADRVFIGNSVRGLMEVKIKRGHNPILV